MAKENKTTENKNSVKDFLNTVTDEAKRKDCFRIIEIFEKESGYKAKMWGTAIVGFGSVHYKYDSGREGDMPLAGFSLRKGAIVLYLSGKLTNGIELLKKFGKHKTGKSCIYINRLADVDVEVLKELVGVTVKGRGIGG
jgi:hypothetical protein